MQVQGYAGFAEDHRGLEVAVLRRPWRPRFVQPVIEALAEVGLFASEVEENARTMPAWRRRVNPEVRSQSLVAAAVLVAVMAALCVLPAVVELVLLLVAWPIWWVALHHPRVPRTVEVRRGAGVVTSVRARDLAHADELCATFRRRIAAGGPLEPEPTDFSDLLVRPRRGRPRGASRHTGGRPGR